MCDKFFDSVGVSEDVLFAGGGTVNVIHQVGEKVEGGFLAHFMLAQFFRKYSKEADGARVLLILNHHSKMHWLSLGSKLGINLSALEEKGALLVVDLMKEVYQSLKPGSENNGDPTCLTNLYSRCEKHIQDFKKCGSQRVFVIVEDLSNFLNSDRNLFQSSEREVVNFLLKLRALSVTETNSCSISIAGLVYSTQLPTDSLELSRFAKTVTNALSTISFEISPLSTGFSAQVTGFLKVAYNPRKLSNERRVEQAFIRNYHFKLDSNGARATAL